MILEVKGYNPDDAIKNPRKTSEEMGKVDSFEKSFNKMHEVLDTMEYYGLNQGNDAEIVGCYVFNGDAPDEATKDHIRRILTENHHAVKDKIMVMYYSSALCQNILEQLEQKKNKAEAKDEMAREIAKIAKAKEAEAQREIAKAKDELAKAKDESFKEGKIVYLLEKAHKKNLKHEDIVKYVSEELGSEFTEKEIIEISKKHGL